MKIDPGGRNLLGILLLLVVGLSGFYLSIAVRFRMWTPYWAVTPTARVYAAPPQGFPPQRNIAVARGRRVYQELRCGVCHGPHGEGGVKNPNADPEGMVPDLLGLEDAYTAEDLVRKIKEGYQTERLEEDGAHPPLHMPGWAKLVSSSRLDNLNRYLFTLEVPPGGEDDNADEVEEEDGEEEDEEEEDEEEEL